MARGYAIPQFYLSGDPKRAFPMSAAAKGSRNSSFASAAAAIGKLHHGELKIDFRAGAHQRDQRDRGRWRRVHRAAGRKLFFFVETV
jgi:hypothetical protein